MHPFAAVLADRRRWPVELTAAALRDALAGGLDSNAHLEESRGKGTLLHVAVAGGNAGDPLLPLDVLDVLLEHGADVNAHDALGRTPLMVVPATDTDVERSVAIMRRLLDAGGRVSRSNHPGDVTGSLHYTSLPLETYALLFEGGARIDERDDRGNLPIHSATAAGHGDKVGFLLDHGADANALSGLGLTPLALAMRTRGEIWVTHNKLTSRFDAIIAELESRKAQEVIAYAWDGTPFGLRPLPHGVVPGDFHSVQDLVSRSRHGGEPEKLLAIAKALADALGEPRTLVIDGDFETHRRPFFWHGDVKISGDAVFGAPSLVTGSVIVSGVVEDCANDSCVTIGGDLDALALYTDGDFAVGRTITAREVVMGYYNDFSLVAETIRAPVVIEDDHSTMASVESPHHFDMDRYRQGYGDGVAEELRTIFVDDVFDDEGQLDSGALFGKLHKRERVRREG